MQWVEDVDNLYNGYKKAFELNDLNLLLIQYNDQVYLIEDKCGHFGVSLIAAKLDEEQDKNVIICHHHGISFDLETGEVVNRPWETCDPIRLINYKIEKGKLYADL